MLKYCGQLRRQRAVLYEILLPGEARSVAFQTEVLRVAVSGKSVRDALHGEVGGVSAQELTALWRQVEALKETAAVPDPTPLWTCC